MVGDEIGLTVYARGDAERFAALFAQCAPAIQAFAYRRTGDWWVAEDVTAQTFLQAWQAWPRYEERGASARAWIMRIAVGVLVDHARRRRREADLLTALSLVRGSNGEMARTVDEEAARMLDHTHIGMALAALPTKPRRAMWLRYGADQAISDVAVRIGRSPGATKQLLHRTLATLRAEVTAATNREASHEQ